MLAMVISVKIQLLFTRLNQVMDASYMAVCYWVNL